MVCKIKLNNKLFFEFCIFKFFKQTYIRKSHKVLNRPIKYLCESILHIGRYLDYGRDYDPVHMKLQGNIFRLKFD